MRAQDAQGTPTQSHISPSILVYEDISQLGWPPPPSVDRRQVNSAHIRESGPDSGPGFRVKILKPL